MPSVLLATAGYDHTIRMWEASNGKCYHKFQFLDSQVNCISISPDKRFVVAAGNPQVRLFDVNSKDATPLNVFEGHTDNVTAVGFQKDGKWMYTGSEDGMLKIWDLRTPVASREFGSCQREYESRAAINTVVLHPNQGELIAGDQSGGICVFDLAMDKISAKLEPRGGDEVAVRSVTVAADASLAVACNNMGQCTVWSLTKGDDMATHFGEPFVFQAHDTYILKCILSPDVSYLATASADTTIKLWKVEELVPGKRPEPYKVLSGHTRWVWDCVFSADSAYMVSASSDCQARLWDIEQGETVRNYTGHQKAVTAVALNDAAAE